MGALNSTQVILLVYGALVIVAVLSALLSWVNKPKHISRDDWQHTFWQGVSTEMIGAILTGLIFTFVVDATIVTLRGAVLTNANFANPP